MNETMDKEEKQRLKQERRQAFLKAHPELAAKQADANERKQENRKKKEEADLNSLNDQQQARRQKMEELRKTGIDPFGGAFAVNTDAESIKTAYEKTAAQNLAEERHEVALAGRIMAKRRMGKLGFASLLDRTGRIQLVVNQRLTGEELYDLFKKTDIGDIIGVKGIVIKTETGELSVEVHELAHLAKALRPLPEKFHGLTDKEERYRRRYLDLIMNDDARRIAILRPRIIKAIRDYMDSQGYIEVETPILQPLLGGANAKPFITHHNALDRDFYLRIATELELKRLIVGGLEKVYEIGRIFRNEGMDLKHNPEFTTMEAYCAYSDLTGMMELSEGLLEYVALKVFEKTDFTFGGHTISFKKPFKRWNMVEAVKEVTGIDFQKNMSVDEALKLAEASGIEVLPHQRSVGHVISLFFDNFCEEKIIQPTFVTGHPIEVSPLAKKDPADPRFTQRFELEICGMEINNAFTELNDPIDQKARFEEQLRNKAAGDEEACEMDTDFIEALEYGMPPTGGIGFGIDRLIMLMSGQESIREVLLFPTMKSLDR